VSSIKDKHLKFGKQTISTLRTGPNYNGDSRLKDDAKYFKIIAIQFWWIICEFNPHSMLIF